MIQVVLVYDEKDFDPIEQDGLGGFFQACAIHFKTQVELNEQFEIIEIISDDLIQNTVVNTLQTLQGSVFLLIAYSHGKEDALLCDNKQISYLVAPDHLHLIKNSLFYTWSCSSGVLLGPQAVDEGCKVFFGYDNLVMASANPNYVDGFVDTANSGLLSLLNGRSIKQTYIDMTNRYDWYIDNVYQNDYMVASFYRTNRDSLVLHGNDLNMTLGDFNIA